MNYCGLEYIFCAGAAPGFQDWRVQNFSFFLLPSRLYPAEVPGFTRISWIVLVEVGSGLLNPLASAAPDSVVDIIVFT
jgi:hypothetical protein